MTMSNQRNLLNDLNDLAQLQPDAAQQIPAVERTGCNRCSAVDINNSPCLLAQLEPTSVAACAIFLPPPLPC